MKKIILNEEDFNKNFRREFKRIKANWKFRRDLIKKNNPSSMRPTEEAMLLVQKCKLIAFASLIITIINPWKIKMKNEHYQLWFFITKMLENHITIMENSEFYITTLLTKYFLESCAGIIKYQQHLKHYFYNDSCQEIKNFSKGQKENISLKIQDYLGISAKWIYKRINAFAHPFYGSLYGLSINKAYWRNEEVIFWLCKSYLLCIPKVFKILNYELILNFDKAFVIFKDYEKNFQKELLKQKR